MVMSDTRRSPSLALAGGGLFRSSRSPLSHAVRLSSDSQFFSKLRFVYQPCGHNWLGLFGGVTMMKFS